MKRTILILIVFIISFYTAGYAGDGNRRNENREKRDLSNSKRGKWRQKRFLKLKARFHKRIIKLKEGRKFKLKNFVLVLGLIAFAAGFYFLYTYSVVLAIVLAALIIIALIFILWLIIRALIALFRLIIQIGRKIAKILQGLQGCFGCFRVLG